MAVDAQDHLRRGDVDAARAALQERIRAEPASAELRVFLFQLLCVSGEWDRALTQLSVAGELDAGTLGMVETYREAVNSESLRAQVFSGSRMPLIFGDPERWVALLLEALKLTGTGEVARGQTLREEAFEAAPALPGTINGTPFQWLADADPRLGPVIEALVNGRYYWIPFACIAELRIEEPEDLRDVVWMPAEFRWTNGGEAVGLIPTRYPGSERHEDAGIRLGRRTQWQDLGADLYAGLGQRMLATDAEEYSLMDVREIRFAAVDGAEAPARDDG